MPRRRGRGSQGERLTHDPGRSQEFRDFREYADGDDLRHLDWNVLARLGNRVVRNYQDEQELKVTLILDGTASMGIGDGAKWRTAISVASALGYVALQGGDALQAYLLGSATQLRFVRGGASIGKWAVWLGGLQVSEASASLARGCEKVAASLTTPGLTIVVSDGLDPAAEAALRGLARRGQEVWLVQVLAEEELQPPFTGDLELQDVDTGQIRVCTITEEARAVYLQNLDRHNAILFDGCQRTGGRAMTARAGSSVDRLLRDIWRPLRWLG